MKFDLSSVLARRVEAENPPIWYGDLSDDCSSHWAGFLLRAEWMEDTFWWWSVTDLASGMTIADSNQLIIPVTSGELARQSCVDAVRRFLG